MTKMYRNKKNGGLYELLGEAIDVTNSRNGMEVVIYRPHGMAGVAQIYVREWMEFEQKFERVESAGLTPNVK